MEAETVRGDKTRGEFASMEADVDGRVDAVQVVEHKHLPVVLGHGHVGVLRLHEVEADDARVLRGDLEGEESLGKDLLRRERTKDLIEEADLYRAGGPGIWLATVFDFV